MRAAAKAWAKSFAVGAAEVGSWDAPVWWHETDRVWGNFAERAYADGEVRYRNRFGTIPSRFQETTLVQINPPSQGRNTNRQGLFARDDNDHLWVLHLGRIHPAPDYVGEDEFARYAPKAGRTRVTFADGHRVMAHAVANISAGPAAIRSQMASFVQLCEAIRLDLAGQGKAAEATEVVARLEAKLFPEPTQDFLVDAKAAALRARRHGRVWHALVQHLQRHQQTVSNARVGRHGPDLYLLGDNPVLFEIKSDASAGSIQQGLGQLLLYEKLLNGAFTKVLVLPHGEDGDLEAAAKALGVRILRYGHRGAGVLFTPKAVRTAIAT
ncbi:MAG: hypothetical protein U1C74_18555 [Phenylobacterium sp.]|nr:hypothetical protein [Phenylobacterium sp.]